MPKPPAYDSPDGRDPYGFPRGYEPPVGPAERGGFGWGGFGIKF